MRTLIIAGLALIQLCSLNSVVNAQNAVARVNVSSINAKHTAVLNYKAEKNFRRDFKQAYNTKWIEKDDGYRAKFVDNDISYMVDYNKKGTWVSTISNYTEDHFDSRLANAVKTAYLGYAIVHVTEIHKGKSTVYLVKIDNQKYLKTIRVENGEMDVFESYVKS